MSQINRNGKPFFDYLRVKLLQLGGMLGLATTSTDGIVLQNNTLSTAAVPVQQGPRLRFHDHVWNTTTPADNTDDWIVESIPASSASPTGALKFSWSANGGAYSLAFTINGSGTLTVAGSIVAAGGNIALANGTMSALFFKTLTATITPLGGGSALSFGTTGGSGPAAAAQNGWVEMEDSTGAVVFVPVWK
jgi:hypothetical protein